MGQFIRDLGLRSANIKDGNCMRGIIANALWEKRGAGNEDQQPGQQPGQQLGQQQRTSGNCASSSNSITTSNMSTKGTTDTWRYAPRRSGENPLDYQWDSEDSCVANDKPMGHIWDIRSSEDDDTDNDTATQATKVKAKDLVLLEFPFNVLEQTLSQAAKELKELGGYGFGVTNDDVAMSNASGYCSSQRTDQQIISIGKVDKLSLAPGQMLVDPIIELCMKW